MQYQDSYMYLRGEGVQYQERLFSTKVGTSQLVVMVCSIKRGCGVPR